MYIHLTLIVAYYCTCILYNNISINILCVFFWLVVDLIFKFMEFHEAVGDKYRSEPIRFFLHI